ncbi:DUF1467 family protein [Amaricoccus tamworthensis]|uniref:DUF1467 family protein n=1 Tax=Amaricoccus tamworthensis TaxID=57002 RepID=UPI003C7D36BA
MTITSAIVLYSVLWFLGLLVALPIGVRTQGESNDVVPGTPASAPVNPRIAKKMIWVTGIAAVLWAVIFSVIQWGGITIEDLDFFNRM